MSIRSISPSYSAPRPAPVATPESKQPVVREPAAKPAREGTISGREAGLAPRADQRDTVSLSDAGRALSGAAESGSLTPARVADLRRKVLEGAYNQAGVVDQVAKRLLSSGDV